jgi:signal transduction histidine kinase
VTPRGSGRSRAWRAWLAGGVAIASLVVGAILAMTVAASQEPGTAPAADALTALTFAAFPMMGTIITVRQPGNRIGSLFLAIGLAVGLSTLTGTAVDAGLPQGAREWLSWCSQMFGVAALPLLVLVMLVFPDGRLLSRRWRVVVWLDMLAAATLAIGLAFTPGPFPGQSGVVNPLGIPGFEGSMLEEGGLGWVLLPVAVVSAAVSMVLRLRRAEGIERLQMKWFAFAAVLVALGFLVSSFTYGTSLQDSFLAVAISQLGVAALPIAAGLAILRYRLYEIDVVVSKAVVYGLLAAFITIVYVGVVVGVGALARNVGNAFLSATAAAVVAIAFQPVRRWTQRVANRIVYGARASPYEVLTTFSERMGASYAADDALPQMAKILAEGTGAESATVWLHVRGALRAEASWPSATAPAVLPADAVDVTDRGELLGALSLEMPPNDPMNPRTEKLVRDLAAQAGLVLRNVRLVEELRGSRKRIVTAQDERAKTLERNIHDGAQQQLVALAIKQNLAATLVGRDDDRLRDTLEELKADTLDALENLRDLARGIYPPLLADEGLAVAIEAQGRKSPIPVTLEADGVGRYPQEVEAAVYFSVLEALQNVTKYAAASHAVVRLRSSDGELRFEVSDDGRGFDPSELGYGTGLQGIADRLAALDGELVVDSSPDHGTSIGGRVPTAR